MARGPSRRLVGSMRPTWSLMRWQAWELTQPLPNAALDFGCSSGRVVRVLAAYLPRDRVAWL